MILPLLILLFAIIVGYAGYCNAIMDLISPKDALAHRGYEWTKEAMEASKDRNKDGRISFMEDAWPDDKWHEHKREMNAAIGVACAILLGIGIMLAFYPIKIIYIIGLCLICTPVYFILISASFQFFYTRIKK